jgi:hypothetical protein
VEIRRERINIGMRDRIRVCRMCGEKKETIQHLLNECVELREREMKVEKKC